ncbi:MAG: YitT family protein [Lachnospiraceae bacterium]|nr:YitT family protein [Lachnospiraceae bacterium]
MKKTTKWGLWFLEIVGGCAIFSLGFDLFLEPNGLNAGGLSGLSMILVQLLQRGSVGTVTLLLNIPLFLISWRSIGRKFFFGSLLGAVSMSFWLEVFQGLPTVTAEPLLAALYGGLITGGGLGLVFLSGASSGGSDIIVRLLKKRWRDIPIGKITLGFDSVVMVLTGLVFQDFSKILYCAITLYVSSKALDGVVYSFDYSKVALIISHEHNAIVEAIGTKLDRGATFLYAQGSYSREDTKIVLTVVKRHQLAVLKALVMHIDPDAFVISQDSHQVLGDGFVRYSEDLL